MLTEYKYICFLIEVRNNPSEFSEDIPLLVLENYLLELGEIFQRKS